MGSIPSSFSVDLHTTNRVSRSSSEAMEIFLLGRFNYSLCFQDTKRGQGKVLLILRGTYWWLLFGDGDTISCSWQASQHNAWLLLVFFDLFSPIIRQANIKAPKTTLWLITNAQTVCSVLYVMLQSILWQRGYHTRANFGIRSTIHCVYKSRHVVCILPITRGRTVLHKHSFVSNINFAHKLLDLCLVWLRNVFYAI